MRLLLNCLCFMSGFWLVVASGLSYAETIAATQQSEPAPWRGQRIHGVNGPEAGYFYTGPSAASFGPAQCTYHASTLSPPQGASYTGWNSNYLRNEATFTVWTGVNTCGSASQYCPSGGASGSTPNMMCNTGIGCPAGQGWTLSGSTCTRPDCTAGQTRGTDGICRSSCPGAGTSTSGVTGAAYGGAGIMPPTLCIGGCSYDWSGVGVQLANEWATTAGKATGSSCSVSATGSNGTPTQSEPESAMKPKSAGDCIQSGQGFGTVNGVTVCTGPADSTSTKTSSTTNTTRPDGSTGTTTTTTTTTCNAAGSCSTTNTTNVSGGGGSGTQTNGTTTEATTEEKLAFCQKNPTAPACQKNEQEDYCKAHPETAGCKELGTPSDGSDQIGTKSLGVSSVSVINLATDMSCPPPIQLPRNLGVVSWQPACDFSGLVKPLVLVFAWLSAGLIVIGGIRG